MVRIPAGATNIDVRQHSFSGKSEDDNYLGEMGCPLPFVGILALWSSWHVLLPSLSHVESFQVSCIFIKEVNLEIHYVISPSYIHPQSIDLRIM